MYPENSVSTASKYAVVMCFENDLSAGWAVELIILDPVGPDVAAAGRIEDGCFDRLDKLLGVCESVHS
jgi:hypothetical protein